jgi:hypothetical protein
MARSYLSGMTAVLAFCLLGSAPAAEPATSTVTVSAHPSGEGFNIQGSFVVPLSPCQAYNYLTDYDVEREMPGVVSIKYHRIAPRRIQLQRDLEERVLFLPVQIQSLVEITEQPYRGTDFVQLSGNARSYRGQWRLEPTGSGTRFVYKAQTDPGSMFPDAMARQVIEDSLRRSFDAMAALAERRQNQLLGKCSSGA